MGKHAAAVVVGIILLVAVFGRTPGAKPSSAPQPFVAPPMGRGVVVDPVPSGASAPADEVVDGYYRADGRYVAPYHRTRADADPTNNYSHTGNVNPYTGQRGRRR